MIEIGTQVIWNDGKIMNEGIIMNYYQFKTEKYYNKYKYALLIKCNSGHHVLKLKKDIKENLY